MCSIFQKTAYCNTVYYPIITLVTSHSKCIKLRIERWLPKSLGRVKTQARQCTVFLSRFQLSHTRRGNWP